MTAVTAFIAGVLKVGVAAVYSAYASIAFQVYQSKKQRKAAKNAAEARKGYELTVEGSIQAIPLVYGRAKVGGVRVFSDTASSFINATGGDKTFNVGIPGETGRTFVDYIWNPSTEQYDPVTVTLPDAAGGLLAQNLSGKKNEFLFVQQALCRGPIHKCYDLLVDERGLDDPSLASGDAQKPKAAFRAEVYYAGGVTCPLVSANFGGRATATFEEVAYLSAVIRLDRDNPQFNNVPPISAIIEGRLVHKVSPLGVLTAREYSNNPAYCLLDYLMDTEAGGAIPVESLDLMSFRAAASVCDTVVLPNAAVGGKIWQPVDGARNISRRNIPLYEANIIIDTTKPVRDNIEILLGTMGHARLVWSQGRYHLSLQYPESNEAVSISATLTDDDIALNEPVEINWPTASERLNYATIRFSNEASNFTEDTASWPPKEAGTYWRGIGARVYPAASDSWGGGNAFEQLMDSLAVWSTAGKTPNLHWAFFVRNAGTYTFEFAVDNSVSGTVNGVAFSGSYGSVGSVSVPIAANSIVHVYANCTDTGGKRGFAAKLVSPTGVMPWNTRSTAYDEVTLITQTSYVYDAYVAQDSGAQLETESFADGITDYYHALAKAEELVRTSRSAYVLKLRYFIKSCYFEPGDFIRINSESLHINAIFRIDEVEPGDDLVASITCSRFDYLQLAWNVADDALGMVPAAPGTELPAPPWVNYDSSAVLLGTSAGSVKWGLVNDVRVVAYKAYFHPSGAMSGGEPVFHELGVSSSDSLDLPVIIEDAGVFGVRSMSAFGQLSAMTLSDPVLILRGKVPPKPTDFTGEASSIASVLNFEWTIPAKRADDSDYNDHLATIIYRGTTDDLAGASPIGQSAGTVFTDSAGLIGEYYYWARFTTMTGVEGPVSDVVGPLRFMLSGGLDPEAEAPPPPLSPALSVGLSHVKVTWLNPVHTVGGGHRSVRVYGATWKTGDAPALAFITEVVGDEVVYIPSDIAAFWRIQLTSVSRAGGESTAVPTPPLSGKTGTIGGIDLGPQIISAYNIATGGISGGNLASEIGYVKHVSGPLPLTYQGDYIENGGKLYRWDGSVYRAIVNAEDLVGQITETQILPGSISTPLLKAGAVTAAKVYAGAIEANKLTAAHIKAGSLTADRLEAGTLTAGSGAFGYLAVHNLLASDLIATSGDIANLQVDTLRVKGNAITTMNFGSSGYDSGSSSWDGPTTTLTGFPASGSSGVVCQGFVTLKSSGYNGNGWLELARSKGFGYTTLSSLPISIVDDKNYTFGIGAFDNSPGAVNTYRLQLRSVTPGFIIQGAHIVATGGKR